MRIYICGPYSANNVIQVLNNIREGMAAGTRLFAKGYSPFVPFHDHLFHFQPGSEALTVQDYYRYSLDWLSVSEAVLVLPGWENSVGTKAEIAEAERLGIPVFYDEADLDLYCQWKAGP